MTHDTRCTNATATMYREGRTGMATIRTAAWRLFLTFPFVFPMWRTPAE